MKQFLSIIMVLAMIFAMSTTAFAAEQETFALTIAGTNGHTYNVYQIYTGNVAEEGGTLVLSNVKYGMNHTPVDGTEGLPEVCRSGKLFPHADFRYALCCCK